MPKPVSYQTFHVQSSDQLTEADLPLVSTICRASWGAGLERGTAAILQDVLDAMSKHPHWKSVTRLCLVRRVAASNQLRCEASVMADRTTGNLIQAGYACFVSPDSSLFHLPPGMVRYFDDATEVVGSFRAAGRLPQRSIEFVSRMQLQSGLAISVGEAGFIFMNARAAGAFSHLKPCEVVLLGPLVQLGQALLDKLGKFSDEFYSWREAIGVESRGRLFDSLEFSGLLQRTLSRLGLGQVATIIEESQSPRFLVCYAGLINILARGLASQGAAAQTILWQVKGDKIQFTLTFGAAINRGEQKSRVAAERQIQADGILLGYRVAILEKGIEVVVPFDEHPETASSLLYSVA